MFDMETSPFEMSPSTTTTESPPGNPLLFTSPIASPIANKKIAKKRAFFWCTHVGCKRTTPFTQKVNMEWHVKSVHLKIKFMCPICNNNISSHSNLSAHIDKTHAPPGKHCAICNKYMRGDMARHCRTDEHRRNMGE
jgi:transcription elongation factor Elf1